MLCGNHCTCASPQPYILKHLQEVNDQIAKVSESCTMTLSMMASYPLQDEQLVRQYREDTSKMREQIKELQTR